MRTFSLGAGADTAVFESTVSANGVDTITGFTAGARGDVLAINKLLGVGITFDPSKFFAASGSGDLTVGGGKQVLIHAGSTKIAVGANSSSFGNDVSSKYKLGDGKTIFIVDTVDDANILYLATETASNSSSTVKVEKVGTLNAGTDITSLTADNFGDVA